MKVGFFVLSVFALICVVSVGGTHAQDCEPNVGLDFHAKDIDRSTEEVKAYDPLKGGNMVHESNDNYILFALSKSARDEWLGRWKDFKRGGPCDKIDPALDALAAAVAAKIGTSSPRAEDFRFHDLAGEKVLLTLLEAPKTTKVFKVGFDSATWAIQKDDSGLPSYRYKDGYIWARDTAEDQPYCHLFSARVKEDYAGGGTYGTKMYRSSSQDRMIGCPAANVK
jgi:hypothetical protein